jgi:hypothetical protein
MKKTNKWNFFKSIWKMINKEIKRLQ